MKAQLQTTSPPRRIAVSMRFFALYFSSRATTVNISSRARVGKAEIRHALHHLEGDDHAERWQRRRAQKAQREDERQHRGGPARPETLDQLAVAKICSSSVKMLPPKSMIAKICVRVAGSVEALRTTSCWMK